MVSTPSSTRFQTVMPSSLRKPASRFISLIALAREPEDASLTGGTRSLDRRLSALNLAGSMAGFGAVAKSFVASRRPSAA